MNQKIQIAYEKHKLKSLKEIPKNFDRFYESILAAHDALEESYSPYSHFCVGAAIQLVDGRIIKGANQEVAAFPSCLCAERVALAQAQHALSTHPIDHISIVAYASNKKKYALASPCGSCRQALLEARNRQEKTFPVILIAPTVGIIKISRVEDLLPFGFDGELM